MDGCVPKLARVATLALLLGCATTSPQQTTTTLDDHQMESLRQRQEVLERRLDNMDQRLEILVRRLEGGTPAPQSEPLDRVWLEPARRASGGEAEADEFNPPLAQAPRTGPTTAEAAAASDLVRSDPKAAYDKGRELFLKGRFQEAESIFTAIAQRHPRHALADNSVYWYGVCQYEMGEYEAAIEELQSLPVRYPRSAKVPDALLKIGEAYLAMDDMVSGKIFLEQVLEQFPESEAAVAATRLLETITQPATAQPDALDTGAPE